MEQRVGQGDGGKEVRARGGEVKYKSAARRRTRPSTPYPLLAVSRLRSLHLYGDGLEGPSNDLNGALRQLNSVQRSAC